MARRHQKELDQLPRFDSDRRGEPDVDSFAGNRRMMPASGSGGNGSAYGAGGAATGNARRGGAPAGDAHDVAENRAVAKGTHGITPEYDPVLFKPQDYRAEIKRVKRKRRLIGFLVVIAVLAVLLIVCVAVFKIPGALIKVDSDAMAQTFTRGQTVLVQAVDQPADGDVIVYRDADAAMQFTRVLAASGEWVNVTNDGKVVVSDSSLEGTGSSNSSDQGATVVASKQVPDSACFVMNDNEDNAFDALYRSENYVSESSIVGRVAFTL